MKMMCTLKKIRNPLFIFLFAVTVSALAAKEEARPVSGENSPQAPPAAGVADQTAPLRVQPPEVFLPPASPGIAFDADRMHQRHRRIIFGGNGYENAWGEEAERRGLANLANTAQALPKYILPKNIELMTRQGVYSKEEILSRHEIHMEKYCKVIRIEARTLVDMVQHEILDAVSAYEDRLCGTVLRKRQAAPEITCHVEKSLASTLAIRNEELREEVVALKTALETEPADAAMEERVTYYHEVVEAGMEKVCETVNQLEALTATRDWPYPTFYKLLFSV